MNPEILLQQAVDLVTAYPYPAGAVVVVLAVLAYFKLKLVLKFITASLILGVVAYVVLFIVNLTSTGMKSTEQFLDRPSQAIDKLRQ